MFLELRENTPHGTKEYPYSQYYIRKTRTPFQFPVHWHDELEIIYIREGVLHVWIDGCDYRGQAGSIFLVNPRELHLMGSDDLSVAYYTLLFPLELISFQTIDELDSSLLMPLRSGQLQLQHEIQTEGFSEPLCCFIEQIIHLNQEKASLHCQLKTRILLLEFLNLLVERGYLTEPMFQGRHLSTQRELLTYVREHYTEKLSLDELALQFHMSPKYVSRYFKEHFHITFVDYVNYLRLTHAKRLLETTALQVIEIALCSGFPNVSYFIRLFKEKYGCTPLKYRQQKSRQDNVPVSTS